MLKPLTGTEAKNAQEPESSEQGNRDKAISKIATTTSTAATATLAPNENSTTIPEKVSGLEILAAAGLPTPKHRLHLDASFFNDPTAEKVAELEQFAKKIKTPRVIFRSAHRRESEFSGGAFHSKTIDLVVFQQYGIQGAKAIRQRIIKASDPKNSARVRRDINLRGIKDFDIGDMGIYLNEAVPSIIQITAVPLDNGEISLRYFFNNESLEVENVDPNMNIREIIQVIIRDALGRNISIQVDRQALIEDIKKAQACFDTPQEFEIHITQKGKTEYGKWVFVQSKEVTPEKTTNDTIPEDIYAKGAKRYHPNHPSGLTYRIIRANNRDVVRQTTAIIIDEAEWIRQWIIDNIPGEERFGRYYPYDRDRLPQEAHSAEGLVENSNFVRKFLLNEPECLQAIINKYLELIELATKTETVTVMQKTTRTNDRDSTYNEWENPENPMQEIATLRTTLVSLASVVFKGVTEGDNEISPASDHHTVLGAGNVSQITICYQLSECGDSGANANWKNIQRLKNLKDGDPLTVMIKDGVASLYVPET